MAHVILGVSASVALHRALDVASELRKGGHQVTPHKTENPTEFISPLQFQAITGRRVFHDLFEGADDDAYDHLSPARDGDLLICAPATADLIGRLAHGLADDMVTTTALAFPHEKPRMVAPAMNWRMWENPMVRRNVHTLRDADWEVIEPVEGDLACGDQGVGRLAPVTQLLERVQAAL